MNVWAVPLRVLTWNPCAPVPRWSNQDGGFGRPFCHPLANTNEWRSAQQDVPVGNRYKRDQSVVSPLARGSCTYFRHIGWSLTEIHSTHVQGLLCITYKVKVVVRLCLWWGEKTGLTIRTQTICKHTCEIGEKMYSGDIFYILFCRLIYPILKCRNLHQWGRCQFDKLNESTVHNC